MDKLPPEMWVQIVEKMEVEDTYFFSLVCKDSRQFVGKVFNQEGLCEYAAKNGYLSLLSFLHENGCPWDTWTCAGAAENGHLECLKYAHENGCPWSEYTCANAAMNGHLECLKYAHQNGCEWGTLTCYYAAKNGHLECLRYAHENGVNILVPMQQ